MNGKQSMKKESAECRKLQMHYCEVGLVVAFINAMRRFILLKSCQQHTAINLPFNMDILSLMLNFPLLCISPKCQNEVITQVGGYQ